ncbi:MAG: ParA family protein, partial [Vicinamibacterales bacterium]
RALVPIRRITRKAASMAEAEFATRLAAVRHDPGLLFVDTPGFEAAELQPLLEAADFVVIPVQPTPNDLRAVGQTVQAVKAVGRAHFCFVVTRGVTNARLTNQALLVLSHHGPVATSIILNRVDYAGAMTDGRTIQEVDPKGRGAEETGLLWSYVRERLDREPSRVDQQGSHAHV